MPIIEGRVHTHSGAPLGGVLVSDGRTVGRTDQDGRYTLSVAASQRFVFVTVPTGFAPAQPFYHDLQDQNGHDFTLVPYAPSNAAEFTFVQISDIHLSTQRRMLAADLAQDLARIKQEVGEAHFIVASGDLTAAGQPQEYAAYLQVVQDSGLTVYHAAGNHDDDTEVEARHFMDHLGPTYYSFDYGPVHFVVYDGEAHLRDGGPTAGADFSYVPTLQDQWLQTDLSLQAAGRPIVFINHFPWGDEFYAQWRSVNLIATVSGHWHSSRRYADDATVHYNAPSLGFSGIDQSPRAYRVLRYANGAVRAETRALVPAGVFAGITFRAAPGNRFGAVESGAAQALVLQADWPMFQGHAHRSGHAGDGPKPPLKLAWRAGTGGAIHRASPIVAEGLVFQAAKNEDAAAGNQLVALDACQGTARWSYATKAAIKDAPAYCDGRLFALTVTGQLLALDAATGQLLWNRCLDNPSQRWVFSGPLALDGRLYLGVSSQFVALDQVDGQVLWERRDLGLDDWISSYASPAAQGPYLAVAFYTQPTNLAVLDAATGETLWCIEEGKSHHMYATPVLDPGGRVYAVSGGAVRAFRLEDGALLWETPIALGRNQATPALAEGRLFIATGQGQVQALDAATGQLLWTWEAATDRPLFTPYVRYGKTTLATPVVAGDFVYLGGADGYVYMLDTKTGACVWQYDLGVPLAAAPALSGNGLWVGGCDGWVYAFAGG